MIHSYQTYLPIYQKRPEILDALKSNQVVIVAGETGSGKTTQLPFICIEAGRGCTGKIVCTQPRRLAAISLANYLSSSINSATGREIGYQVRFREKVSDETIIKFVTDGILLGEIVNDPLLKQYDTIIIDEAHERSVNVDFLLGYLRSLLVKRSDLKVIISSATIDIRLFSKAFSNAPVITVSGRMYPVDIQYRPVIELWKGECMDSYIEGSIAVVREILGNYEEGDILIFLPTVQDIIDLIHRLEPIVKDNAIILPLHSRLPYTTQQLIFKKSRKRKIVVSTNIAETSITVPGIRYVIDSGLVRILRYEPVVQVSRMPIERISKASADQRAGRCGRVRDGICIRLYSEADYMSRKAFTTPEIQRSNLAGVLLRMYHIGLGDPAKFLFIQKPSNQAFRCAFIQLNELGAITRKGVITALGKEMARLPLDPPVARILIYAREHDAVRELMIIAAGLSIEDPFVNVNETNKEKKERFRHPDSDFMRLLSVWAISNKVRRNKTERNEFNLFCAANNLSAVKMKEWFDSYQQIRRICRTIRGFIKKRVRPATYEAIHKSLLVGFFSGIVCRSEKDIYNGIHADGIRIFPSSVLFGKNPQWILFHEVIETGRIYGRNAAVINPKWIESIFRSRCQYVYEDPWFDSQSGRVRAREEVTFQGLLLIKNRYIDLEKKDPERAQEIFIKEGLVNEHVGNRYRFICHNREIRDYITLLQHKMRKNLYIGNWALEEFYSERLANVKNRKELNDAIRMNNDDSFLMIKLEELLAVDHELNVVDFPDFINVGNSKCPVNYLFSPGDQFDGVVITVNEELYYSVPEFYWEWLLPVFWRPRIEIILKVINTQLIELSFDPQLVIEEILSELSCANGQFVNAICSILYNHYSILLYSSDIEKQSQPRFLWPVIKVTNNAGVTLNVYRTFFDSSADTAGILSSLWKASCQDYEQDRFTSWQVPFLQSVPVHSNGQVVGITGYPALHIERDSIAVRIFFSFSDASISHAWAIQKIIEFELAEKLAWEFENVVILDNLLQKAQSIWHNLDITESLKSLMLKKIIQLPETLPCDELSFKELLQDADQRIISSINEIKKTFQEVICLIVSCQILLEKKRLKYKNTYLESIYEELRSSLNTYVESVFDADRSINYCSQLPVFLNAFEKRIEFAYDDPGKFHRRMKIVDYFYTIIGNMLKTGKKRSYYTGKKVDNVFLSIESYIKNQFIALPSKKSELIHESDILEKIEELRFAIEMSETLDISCKTNLP